MKKITVLMALILISCGKEQLPQVTDFIPKPETPAPAALAAQPVAVVDTGTSSSSSVNNSVSITYYALTKTGNTSAGGPLKQYIATGYCATYLAKTYCWDDGVSAVTWITSSISSMPPFTVYFTYWGLFLSDRGYLSLGSNDTANTDLMAAPRLIAGAVAVNLGSALSTVNTVMTTGTANTVSCLDNAGVLDCGTFVIDTTQSPL